MHQSNTSISQYKAMPFLIMLYVTLMLAANVVIYKLITFHDMVFSAGIFLIPLVHVVLDIILERYGYDFAKKIILLGLVCQCIFALFCSYLIMIPSPPFWHYQADYDQVLGKLMRVFIGSFLGTFIGMLINAKLISKWKVLVKGKYFWMRCIGASAVGQLLFSIITITYDMYGIQPLGTIIEIIIPSYFFKMLFTCFAATPASVIVAFLKVYEKLPNYELNYNPFKNNKSELSQTEMA
jgi:uncharacterized integral membrane protein (TIGR00697 family)